MFPYLFVKFLSYQLIPSRAKNITQNIINNGTIDHECVDHFQVTSFISGIVFTIFLAAGLPASSIRQYYSCRSSRIFTLWPVMSVNGTIFLINHTCLILFKLFQTCLNLFKLVQICSNFSKLV